MNWKALAVAASLIAVPVAAEAQATSRGPDCPRGCPTSRGHMGLTGAQFLALQQQLRDDGCGVTQVTGVPDAATRRAIRRCAQKYNTSNSARAVLVAMNIGYSDSDLTGPVSGGTASTSNWSSGSTASTDHASMGHAGMNKAEHCKKMAKGKKTSKTKAVGSGGVVEGTPVSAVPAGAATTTEGELDPKPLDKAGKKAIDC